MKNTAVCPKCAGRRVAHVEELWGGGGGRCHLAGSKGFFSAAAGEVEAYICAGCGYFEEYVKNPHAVDWDDIRKLRWL